MKTSNNLKPASSNTDNTLLFNTSNYKPILTETVQLLSSKFVSIVVEYMAAHDKDINIKNTPRYIFICQRGVDLITHVFRLILFYTKNLYLTVYHSKKAYHYYIEFIEQIADDNITFLKLSSQDAIMFVYKKTIYDLNNNYKKSLSPPNAAEKNIFLLFDLHINIYTQIIRNILNCEDFAKERTQTLLLGCNNLNCVRDILVKLKHKFRSHHLECFIKLHHILTNKNECIEQYFININNTFTKLLKYKTQKIDINKFNNIINKYNWTLKNDKNWNDNLDDIFDSYALK